MAPASRRDVRGLGGARRHLPVVEASVRYRAPARFDDVLAIETRLVELRAASLRFEYRMERMVADKVSRASSSPRGSRASPA